MTTNSGPDNSLHTHFDLTLEVLSPVHIGDGTELLKAFDYVVHDNRTWVIDQERFLETCIDPDTGDIPSHVINSQPGDLVEEMDYDPVPGTEESIFRYVLNGEPQNRPIKSFIKSVYGEPYIPGSSIKGMLRTAFVWGLYKTQQRTPDLRKLNRSRSWAAQPLEREVMGSSPNFDLFRALHVSDAQPVSAVERGQRGLEVVPVGVYPTGQGRQTGVVVDVEALQRGIIYTARCTLEEFGFQNEDATQRLGWAGQRDVFDQLAAMGFEFGRQRLIDEVTYFQDRQGVPRIHRFYNDLVNRLDQLEDNQFLAQIGWGAGWNSKTLNDLIKEDRQRFVEIVKDYRLTRFYRDFTAEKQFPSSRHIVYNGQDYIMPVAWVLVTIGLM